MEEKKEVDEIKKIKINTLIKSLGLFVVVFFIVFSVIIYRFSDFVRIPEFVHNRIFLPAVVIDKDNFITIGSINQNLLSIKKFYESQDFSALGYRFDFSTEDGKKRLKIRERELINKMIEDRAIEILAKEKGIDISNSLVDDNVNRKLQEYGNEDSVADNLKRLYGWSIDDFKVKIVKPSLYKDELEKWLQENEGKELKNTSFKDAQIAKEKIKNGDDFDQVAKDISEGATAQTGGKLGWFKENQISKEISADVVVLKKGETSDVLESKLGYHIVKLDDSKELDGEKVFSISQIFFPKMSFANWLSKEIKNMSVMVWISDYDWNNETGMIEFKDKSMEEYSEKIMSGAQQDASLMSL